MFAFSLEFVSLLICLQPIYRIQIMIFIYIYIHHILHIPTSSPTLRGSWCGMPRYWLLFQDQQRVIHWKCYGAVAVLWSQAFSQWLVMLVVQFFFPIGSLLNGYQFGDSFKNRFWNKQSLLIIQVFGGFFGIEGLFRSEIDRVSRSITYYHSLSLLWPPGGILTFSLSAIVTSFVGFVVALTDFFADFLGGAVG